MVERNTFSATWAPRLLSILRIVAGFLFLWHGTQKLFNYPPMPPGVEGPLPTIFIVGGWLELIGGILILLGLFTKIVAFVLSGMMAVAYFMVHAPNGLLPLVNSGELAVLFCFLYLYLALAGGGEWSLDRLVFRERQ